MTDAQRAVWRTAITFGSICGGMILGVMLESYTLSAAIGMFGGTLVGRRLW